MIHWIKSWFPKTTKKSDEPVVYEYTFYARPRGSMGGFSESCIPKLFNLIDGFGEATMTEAEFEEFREQLRQVHFTLTEVERKPYVPTEPVE